MPTDLDINPASAYTILATFRWGSNVARYCRWNSDLTIGGDVFSADPLLSFTLDRAMTGGTEDAACQVTGNIGNAPFDTLSKHTAHAPVRVTIEEISPGDETTRRVIYYGNKDGRCRPRPNGAIEICKVEFSGVKARLALARAGVPALSTCINHFGDRVCGIVKDSIAIAGVVNALNVDGYINRISMNFSGSPDLTNDRFRRGHIVVDGCRISIRKSLDDGTNPDPTSKFDLRYIPPAWWVGETAIVVPGCSGELSVCRTVWNNESRFRGFPFSPDFNPLFSGSSTPIA